MGGVELMEGLEFSLPRNATQHCYSFVFLCGLIEVCGTRSSISRFMGEEKPKTEFRLCEKSHVRRQFFLGYSFATVSRSLKNGTVLPLPEPTRLELWVRVRIRSDTIRG
jgi:hypothetical protein